MSEWVDHQLLDTKAGRKKAKVPIVIIAASAGGLDPITEILDCYPKNLQVATIVIQHLSPAYRSELVGLLQSHTTQHVHELQGDTILIPNNIYVIQPGTQIVLDNEVLKVFSRDTFSRPYFTIDVFLESVAKRGKPINTCVVLLSGTGSDGTAGCRAVRETGGFVVVQQLSDAKFDGMPSSVINSGAYDEIQPANLIPERIGLWLEQGCEPPPQNYIGPEFLVYDEQEMLVSEDPSINPYAAVFLLLRQCFDLDLNAYKVGTIDRRISQRMHKLGYTSIAEYVKLLAQGGAELRTLFNDLMIGVTTFFRNPAVFELLESKVLPAILAKNTGPLKFWVCACSTGEEAYSLAMLVQKLIDQAGTAQEFRVFATDINPAAIRKASDGVYSREVLQPLIDRFDLHQYVAVSEDQCSLRIGQRVRRNIVFSVQNVLKHSPLHGLDMTLCRNMLIYLRPEAQRKVIANFIFGMKDGAVLVLGESEGPAGLEPYFDEIDGRLKIFTKRPGVSLSKKERWHLNQSIPPIRPTLHSIALGAGVKHSPVARSAFEAAFAVVAGNSLIVHADGDVQYLTGFAGEIFDRTAPGRPSLNIHVNVSNLELQSLLQFGLNEALERDRSVEWKLNYQTNGQLKFGGLRFTSIPSTVDGYTSVLIQMLPADEQESVAVVDGQQVIQQLGAGPGGLERLAVLERQNAELRLIVSESMQDKETFHEELQSANEELLSSNEELQSTNEELQSVNEELQSVNEELSEKIRLLTQADSDISNLLAASDAALIFLDEKLHIRRFTQAALRYFPLSSQDHGRAIADLSSNLEDLDINSIADEVIRFKQTSSFEVATKDKLAWLQVVFKPYMDQCGNCRGVVMTLFDVTQMRQQLVEEQKSRIHRDLSKQMLGINYWELSRDRIEGICVGDQFYELLGYEGEPENNTVAQLLELVHADHAQLLADALARIVSNEGSFVLDLPIKRQDDTYHWMMCGGASGFDNRGAMVVVGMFVDINERKLTELRLQEQKRNDIHANRIFNIGMLVSGVAHELNNPLTALQLGCEQLCLRYRNQQLTDEVFNKVMTAQQDAVRRMDSIVSSLLQFSRKENGDQMRLIHVADLLRDVHNLTLNQASGANVRLEFLPAADHLKILCNPVELAQALINLVSNAIQAVDSLVERWVRVEATERDGEIQIRVIDSGLTEKLTNTEKLFTPFYTTKEVGRGTGLGLNLSQNIAENHHGTLRNDAHAHHVTFVLTLPKAQESELTPTLSLML